MNLSFTYLFEDEYCFCMILQYQEHVEILTCISICKNWYQNVKKHLPEIFQLDNRISLYRNAIRGCATNNLKMVQYVLSKGVNIHKDDESLLRTACSKGNLAMTQYLISQGADMSVGDYCVFRFACMDGYLELAKYLISKGANVHAKNDDALQWACVYGHLNVVKFLVSMNADIHAKDENPLQLACAYEHLKVAKFLISKGANVALLNNIYFSNMIKKSKNKKLKSFLKRKGISF